MICLQDRILIKSSAAEAFLWFEQLDKHYLLWHPEHVSCRYVNGRTLQAGAKLYIEEYLHGKLHHFTFTITQVIKNQALYYHMMPGMKGSFHFLEKEDSVDFQADICIGWDLPWLGTFVDKVLGILLAKRVKALQKHMHEEGINLRHILESQRSCAAKD